METQEAKQSMEAEMDRLQPMICPGPCPEWDEFTATLPGYRKHWAMFAIDAADQIDSEGGWVSGYTTGEGPVQPPPAG